jgi:5-methylcytosine-specific restriction endonuclease McrA
MTVSDSLRERVRAAALYRCGYCRVPEIYVYAAMNVDHIIPIA